MKIVQINQVCYASTGKIAIGISDVLEKYNIENYILYTTGDCDRANAIKYGSDIDTKLSAGVAKVFGNYGFNSFYNTHCLIKKLDNIKPDIIHLHNIHGHNVNLKKLFEYIKKRNIKVVWTFHDCWSFTGYCTHFDYEKCYKWQDKCEKCVQYKRYSLIFDKSKSLFKRKKAAAEGLKLSIVTPSVWLSELVKESFYKECPVYVVNNGINLDIFKPTENNFKQKYGIESKKMLLGVATGFTQKKGFDYFLKLSRIIDNDAVIVLVGVSGEQKAKLPNNIIGIERNADQKELAGIYTAADVFINCTLEENFPTVNLEALACGTPIVTFKTGGSVESANGGVGSVVPQGDTEALYQEAKRLMTIDGMSEKCRATAVEKYDEKKRYEDYIEIYKNL